MTFFCLLHLYINFTETKLRSGLTAGTHFSGGLDSSLVGALARRHYFNQKSFYGFSWSPQYFNTETIDFDERELIKDALVSNNIIPIFINFLNKNIWDAPSFSKKLELSIYEDEVVKEASKRGINLIYSGWGGQEFISTEDFAIDIDLLRGCELRKLWEKNSGLKHNQLLKKILYDIVCPILGIANPKTTKVYKEYSRYILPKYKKVPNASHSNLFRYASRKQFHLGLLNNYHIPLRTEMWCVNGYKEGIEYRYPLLDKRIVEFILQVPSKALINGKNTRVLMRELSRGILPENIRLRESTIDPVIYSEFFEHLRQAKDHFEQDIKEFMQNQDMNFIYFNKLNTDLKKIKLEKSSSKNNKFLEIMFSFKMIHEFTKKYRK